VVVGGCVVFGGGDGSDGGGGVEEVTDALRFDEYTALRQKS
jgi:hypothetical protein